MDKEQKEYIKSKAEATATILGFNPNSLNLDVINALEMYCQGYAQALEDQKNNLKKQEQLT